MTRQPDYRPQTEHRGLVRQAAAGVAEHPADDGVAALRGLINPPRFGEGGAEWIELGRAEKPEGTVVRVDIVDRRVPVTVPCLLGLPRGGGSSLPLMVCLQGHSDGMHVSMGVAADDLSVDEPVPGDRDLARQCMSRGIVALCVEQRGFGLRRDNPENRTDCTLMAMRALTLGRTLVGERVADVRLALDAVSRQEGLGLDLSRVGVMGNSAGGTTAMFASVLDERFKLAVPSCSFAPLEASWLFRPHCVCGYVPRMLTVMDLPEMMALRAPRPVVVVGAASDYHVAESDLRAGFARLEQVYGGADEASSNCRLVVGPDGHRFYAELAWPHIEQML